MLPQFGAGEHWLVVIVVLLLVVRPKDLPKTLREIGRWIGKVRSMANEFKANLEDMARQSELDELRAQVEAMRSAQPLAEAQAALDASRVEINAMVNGEVPYQPELEPGLQDATESAPTKPKRVRKPKVVESAPAAEPPGKTAARRKTPVKAKLL